MTAYALVLDNSIIRVRDFDTGNEDVPVLADSKGVWLPLIQTVETFDPVTQRQGSQVTTITADSVTFHFPARDLTTDELNELVQSKLSAISTRYQTEVSSPITLTIGGVDHQFDADDEAVKNISGIVLLIAAGSNIPDPRPWTAYQSLTSIMISHADLIGLGRAIADRKDAKFVVKKTKEYQLSLLTTAADIAGFDTETGW